MPLDEYDFKREVPDAPGKVLVDFWAAWCGPRRAMTPVRNALARDFMVCEVNTETHPRLAADPAAWADAVRGTVAGGLVLGTPAATFARADLAAFAAGIVVGLAADRNLTPDADRGP